MPDPVPAAQPTSEAAPVQTPPQATTTPAGDAKPVENTPAAAPASKPGEQPTPAPAAESKPIELKLPEKSPLDPSRVESIAALAKERGLTPEAAQELLTREHEAAVSVLQAQEAELGKRQAAWVEELKADPEIGGEKFAENAELSKRALDAFGDEDLKKMLIESGMGNYLPVARMLNKIGRAMAEDRLVLPGASAPGPKDDRELFYGKPNN